MVVKDKLKESTRVFIGGILAGIFIGLGGFVNLAVNTLSNENSVVLAKILGAFLFASGLFAVCSFGFHLFTGQVGNSIKNKPWFIAELFIMLIGNIIGTFLVGCLVRFIPELNALKLLAENLMAVKYSKPLWSILFLAVGCGFCMEFAVMGYRELKNHAVVRYISVFFGVMIFILCGLEHIVANFFYMFASFNFGSNMFLSFLMMLIGNTLGAIFLSALVTIFKKLSNNN